MINSKFVIGLAMAAIPWGMVHWAGIVVQAVGLSILVYNLVLTIRKGRANG